jgi:hypothetical protein
MKQLCLYRYKLATSICFGCSACQINSGERLERSNNGQLQDSFRMRSRMHEITVTRGKLEAKLCTAHPDSGPVGSSINLYCHKDHVICAEPITFADMGGEHCKAEKEARGESQGSWSFGMCPKCTNCIQLK